MKLTKLSLAMATALGAGMAADAMALDLYVDQKTQQIFAEPGHGRVKLGSFERVEDSAAQKADNAAQKAEIAKIKEDLALKNNELKALDEHVNDPSLGHLHMDEKGVKFESKDGNFDMNITGRLQVDSQVNVNQAGTTQAATGTASNNLADGMSLRRVRLGVEGAYYKDYGYKFEYDFTRGNGLAGGITDAFLTYKGYEPLTVTVGQYKEFFSLEEATSNRYLTFLERNMVTNTFSDNLNAYKMGLGLSYAQPRWTASAGLQTETVGVSGGPTNDSTSLGANGNSNRSNGSGDTGWGYTGRLTALPWFQDKTKFLHVGVSGSQRYPNNNYNSNTLTPASSNGITRFASNPDTNVDRSLLLDTGLLTNATHEVSKFTRFGGESAVVYGPFSAQAEYIQTEISGRGYNDNNINGAYGYMTYFLTGESRNYKAKTGAWDRIKPNQNFTTHGGLGAWEVALGYDHLDLNSGVIQGGRASTGKIGLNWYPNSRVRLMANYIHVLDINTANVKDTTGAINTRARAFDGSLPDIFEVRGQLDF